MNLILTLFSNEEENDITNYMKNIKNKNNKINKKTDKKYDVRTISKKIEYGMPKIFHRGLSLRSKFIYSKINKNNGGYDYNHSKYYNHCF